MTQVLEVENLNTSFAIPEGEVQAVSEVGFHVDVGECVGIVGESGSGKSQVFMSVMGLLAKNGRASGSVRYRDREILGLPAVELNSFRGSEMTMIFQDPMTSLNPYLRISRQMTEVLIEHKGLSQREARRRCVEVLGRVGISEAEKRLDMYPYELSGGLRQRVMIAMSILCEPELLIADEPTTALDVTIQAQILDLMGDLRRDSNTAIVLITHDLGVVAGLCDRVIVMYGGRIVENAAVRDVFYNPRHPYTLGLLKSSPRLDDERTEDLVTIQGQPPNLQDLPPGCAFSDRCPVSEARCLSERPVLRGIGGGREIACHRESPQ